MGTRSGACDLITCVSALVI